MDRRSESIKDDPTLVIEYVTVRDDGDKSACLLVCSAPMDATNPLRHARPCLPARDNVGTVRARGRLMAEGQRERSGRMAADGSDHEVHPVTTAAEFPETRNARYLRYALAWILGAAGSVTFVLLHLPLPWFLGALTFCLIGSVANAPITRPKPLTIPMRAVLGVAIGTAFSPALFGRIGGMTMSLLLLIPFMMCVIGLGMLFYVKVAKLDLPTAFFSAVPGGLTDMTAMAEDAGANPRTVVLVQASRILLIVFSLPLWLQWHDGLSIGRAVANRAHIWEVPFSDLAVMLAMGWGGWWAARRIGLAGAPIVGPMLVSGLAHALGLTAAKMPLEVLVVAQISIGTLLGAQFRGLTFKEFSNTMIWGLVNAVILLLFTGLIAHWVAGVTHFDPVSVLLAFAPGGQTELNLLAYVLGLDVAYVALHHLLRLGIVILGAQMVFRTSKSWRRT
jgi:membrane AbrB-like protein